VADFSSKLPVTDTSDGPVTPGTAATLSNLIGGQYNSAGVTLTNTQQSALQLASNGSLEVQITNSTPLGVAQSANWIVVGTLTNDNATPAATNIGALVAVAEGTLSSSRYTSGDQVLLVTDLAGNTNVDLQYVAGTACVTAGVAGLQAIGGNVASGSADSGNGVKVAAVAVATVDTLPTVAATDRIDSQADLQGRIYVNAVPVSGSKISYSSATVGLVTAASATDIFTITGSATKTIRVKHIRISGTVSSTTYVDVLLIKRSAANTSGTSTAVNAVPNDSSNPAASATVLSYTANPTLGAVVGTMKSAKLLMNQTVPNNAQSAGVQIPIEWTFGSRGQAITLRGTSQVLAINLNSTTLSGSSFDITIEWQEE